MKAGSRTLTAIALLVVAPIGAAVIVSVLLLFGVTPHLVFLPGFAVRSKLAALGFHAPNAVGVLVTLVVWWAIIVAVWLMARRLGSSMRR
jgi:predicted cobalt transporter CbtA